MFSKNLWYAAAWRYELLVDKPLAVKVANEPVVIYRQADGRIAALTDRCCHCAAPLSMGRIEGNDLRCTYHGMKFNATGQCIEIPGQAKIPRSACVRSYAVAEADVWVWLWLGDPATADTALIPTTRLDRSGWQHRTGTLDYDANYHLINDNLTDFSHVADVHAQTFCRGSEKWAHELPMVTQLDNGVLVERWVTNTDPLPMDPRLLGVKIDLWTSSASTRLEDDRAGIELFFGVSVQAFAEDKATIEAQQRMIDFAPEPAFVNTMHDAGLTRFRRLIDASAASATAVPELIDAPA